MESHLQVPAVRPRIQYIADGAQTVFVYPFPVFAAEDLDVYRNAARIDDGYSVEGAGNSDGGRVVFQSAPAAGERVTIRRRMRIRRMTDFLQGSDMRADSFNDEFDRLTAITQDLSDALDRTILAPVHEDSGTFVLPGRDVRRNKALVFNDAGDLTVSETTPTAGETDGGDNAGDDSGGDHAPDPPPEPDPPDAAAVGYAPAHDGAVERPVADRLGERVSIRDFGAVGDGSGDDTPAFLAALAAAPVVYVPRGEFRVTQPIPLESGHSIVGQGPSSRLVRTGGGVLIDIRGSRCRVAGLMLFSGDPAIRALADGRDIDDPVIEDVMIEGGGAGIILEAVSPHRCHGARISGLRTAGGSGPGLWLAGAYAAAPSFVTVRDAMLVPLPDSAGPALQIEFAGEGVTLSGLVAAAPTDLPAIRLGPGARGIVLTGIVTRRDDDAPHIAMHAYASGNLMVHHRRQGPGSALAGAGHDGMTVVSGVDAATVIPELAATGWRHHEPQILAPESGVVTLDASRSLHLIDATAGEISARLPYPSTWPGAVLTVKKVDTTTAPVIVTNRVGGGPDGRAVYLADRFDAVTMVSDGGTWRVTAGGRPGARCVRREAEPGETLPLDADVYLLSAPSSTPGLISLPNAADERAVGRRVTIKMAGGGAMGLAISEQDGPGPDGADLYLMEAGDAATIVSDGQGWAIIARV
ncbi:glycosyl hydrolase family 28-related protein [Fodinicurvata sp. EGI_FJ10296]|uniref:glycosyl hydrolase family 28-related protein n=1 Tax=Fodinicurvata sp. EGI_FJ10296 TaxID=3231908 RepID=UPI003455A872